MKTFSKVLSVNDTGENKKSHQSGVYIRRQDKTYFPPLNEEEKNPSVELTLRSHGIDFEEYKCRFIYYNSKKFGGTRNECRITNAKGSKKGIGRFLKDSGAKAGDELWLTATELVGVYEAMVIRREISLKTAA